MPPAAAMKRMGDPPLDLAVLAATVLSRTVIVPVARLMIPPPTAEKMKVPVADAVLARTSVRLRVATPWLAIPPPPAEKPLPDTVLAVIRALVRVSVPSL